MTGLQAICWPHLANTNHMTCTSPEAARFTCNLGQVLSMLNSKMCLCLAPHPSSSEASKQYEDNSNTRQGKTRDHSVPTSLAEKVADPASCPLAVELSRTAHQPDIYMLLHWTSGHLFDQHHQAAH